MTLDELTARVEQELQTRRTPFELRDLLAFLEDNHCHVEDEPDPDPSVWADAFLTQQRVEAAFRRAGGEGRVPFVHLREREEG